MKKLMLLAVTAILASSSFAQDSTNVGLEQFSTLSPTPGPVSLSVHESGLSSIVFDFKESSSVDRSKDLFITVKRNDNVMAAIPASNTAQVKYDNIYANVWQVSFFLRPNYECMAGGDYQVIIPEGYFLIGESQTPNSEIVINYTMAIPNIMVYPEESRTCTELQDFIVTFGSAVRIEKNPNAEHGIEFIDHYGGSDDEPATGDDDEYEPSDEDLSFPLNVSVDLNAVKIHLINSVTTGSTYDLIIPSGAFLLYDENGKMTESPELAYQYAIPKVGKGQPVIYPEAGRVLDFPGVIELTLSEGETRGTVNNMGANYLYPVYADGTRGEAIADYRATYEFYKDSQGNVIPENANKIFLKNVLGDDVNICPVPGLYQLVTSNSLYSVRVDGKLINVSSFTYNFEVVDGNLFDMEFNPSTEQTVSSISEIKVTFPYADEIEIKWGTAWLRSATTGYQFYPQGNLENGQTVVFKTAVPVTLPGTYRFTSDMKSVCVDGEYVGICADYVVDPKGSGVNELCNVVILPEMFDICNAQGIVIKRNATLEDLNALPAGIYIAGGKKIVNR